MENEHFEGEDSILTESDRARIERIIGQGKISQGEATKRIIERRKKINELALNENLSPEVAERKFVGQQEENEEIDGI